MDAYLAKRPVGSQIQDAFRASGFNEREVTTYSGAIQNRIKELQQFVAPPTPTEAIRR